jgi:hypothetical protein
LLSICLSFMCNYYHMIINGNIYFENLSLIFLDLIYMHRQCKIILHCQPMTTMYSATSPHFTPLSSYDMKNWWFLIGWLCKIILHRQCISIKLNFFLKLDNSKISSLISVWTKLYWNKMGFVQWLWNSDDHKVKFKWAYIRAIAFWKRS